MSRESKGAYLGSDFSIAQLLCATKKKLQETTAGGRYVQTVPVTFVTVQTRTVQDRNNSKPG